MYKNNKNSYLKCISFAISIVSMATQSSEFKMSIDNVLDKFFVSVYNEQETYNFGLIESGPYYILTYTDHSNDVPSQLNVDKNSGRIIQMRGDQDLKRNPATLDKARIFFANVSSKLTTIPTEQLSEKLRLPTESVEQAKEFFRRSALQEIRMAAQQRGLIGRPGIRAPYDYIGRSLSH